MIAADLLCVDRAHELAAAHENETVFVRQRGCFGSMQELLKTARCLVVLQTSCLGTGGITSGHCQEFCEPIATTDLWICAKSSQL
jgi:hypothetical protein